MFDGFKISVSEKVGLNWLESPLLSFQNVVNTSTGECLDGKRWANYRGLTFILTRSKQSDNLYYCHIIGSFHKYFNNGLHNYNDFSLNDFQDTLTDLETKFNLCLKETSLQRLEFGLNIELTTSVQPIINGLRAYKFTEFSHYLENGNGSILGNTTKTKRTETKIYNKAKQFNLTDKNIIRFEYVLKDKEVFKLNNIHSLEDLRNKDLVYSLGKIIFDVWNDCIFYDGGINIKNWKPQRVAKFSRYLDGKYWTNLNKKQRFRSKLDFFNIIKENDTKQTQSKMAQIIALKWHYLTAVLCPPLGLDFDFSSALEMSTFGTLIYSYQWWTNSIQETNQKKPQKEPKKEGNFSSKKTNQKKAQTSICSVCKKQLEHKRKNTKYCSKKCNNTLNGKRRTSKRKQARNIETEHLQKLLCKIPLNKFWLLVTYKSENLFYTDYLHQSEILTSSKWINKINKIVVSGHQNNAPPIELNTLRAKALIRSINIYNHKKQHQ